MTTERLTPGELRLTRTKRGQLLATVVRLERAVDARVATLPNFVGRNDNRLTEEHRRLARDRRLIDLYRHDIAKYEQLLKDNA